VALVALVDPGDCKVVVAEEAAEDESEPDGTGDPTVHAVTLVSMLPPDPVPVEKQLFDPDSPSSWSVADEKVAVPELSAAVNPEAPATVPRTRTVAKNAPREPNPLGTSRRNRDTPIVLPSITSFGR